MKGGHLEGPFLEAELEELLGERGKMQMMGMCQRGRSPV